MEGQALHWWGHAICGGPEPAQRSVPRRLPLFHQSTVKWRGCGDRRRPGPHNAAPWAPPPTTAATAPAQLPAAALAYPLPLPHLAQRGLLKEFLRRAQATPQAQALASQLPQVLAVLSLLARPPPAADASAASQQRGSPARSFGKQHPQMLLLLPAVADMGWESAQACPVCTLQPATRRCSTAATCCWGPSWMRNVHRRLSRLGVAMMARPPAHPGITASRSLLGLRSLPPVPLPPAGGAWCRRPSRWSCWARRASWRWCTTTCAGGAFSPAHQPWLPGEPSASTLTAFVKSSPQARQAKQAIKAQLRWRRLGEGRHVAAVHLESWEGR